MNSSLINENQSQTNNLTKYDRKEVYDETLKYFKGDTLATEVWINKYALKDSFGNIYEKTPNDMHRRLAKELARIEAKYPNGLSEDEIFETIKDFKYIIPQGGSMNAIGNDLQILSISNCFVIGEHPHDSYGSICMVDQQQIQLMKRRGGVGHDLSHIRPTGAPVKNSALTSTGIVPFLERYSNSTREVAQDGRRGALMLSLSIKHPDAESFIDAKMTQGRVTGANISIKIDNSFMKAIKNDEYYIETFPIDANLTLPLSIEQYEFNKLYWTKDSENETIYFKKINPKKLWDKIIYNAWKSAEPGILFGIQ